MSKEDRYELLKKVAKTDRGRNNINEFEEYVLNGTPLPKGHSFIAICDSDFPITEEVKEELKDTVFAGNEDCPYCFDITEIIEADKEDYYD